MHQSIKIPALRHPGQTGEFNTDYSNTNNNKQERIAITLFCLPVVKKPVFTLLNPRHSTKVPGI